MHITQGCLSSINPGCGTNRNDNLHRSINPFFSRCRMGIPLAVALLTVLFHQHNQKLMPSTVASPIISARALYRNTSIVPNVRFGVMSKTETPNVDSWIFGSHIPQSMPQLPPGEVVDFAIDPELGDIVTFEDISTLLRSSLNLLELDKSLQKQTKSSVMLNQRMIPFMSSVSSL